MKKLLTAILLFVFCSFSAMSQSKADSIAKAEAGKIVQDIITKTVIKTFQEWLYTTMPANKYDEFITNYYNWFVQQQFDEISKKKKLPK